MFGLHWRCDLPAAASVDGIVEAMVARYDFVDRSPAPVLRVLTASDGARILIVSSTGRVQIRVSYATAKDERKTRAEIIAEQLNEVLDAWTVDEVPREDISR